MADKQEKYDMDIVRCFLSEGKELIDEFEHVLLDFDKGQKTPEMTGKLFRMMHNLKGASKTAGFSRLTDFCHSIENVLQNIRNNKLYPSKEVCSVLFKALDLLKSYLSGIGVDIDFTMDTSFIEKELKFVSTGDSNYSEEKLIQKDYQNNDSTTTNDNLLPPKSKSTPSSTTPISTQNLNQELLNAINNKNIDPTKTNILENNNVVVINKVNNTNNNTNNPFPSLSLTSATSNEASNAISSSTLNQNSTNNLLGSENDNGHKSVYNKKIGEILIEQGIATEEQIEKVINVQKNSGSTGSTSGAVNSIKEEQIRVGLWRLDSLINFIGELIIYHSMIKERTAQLGIDDGVLLEAISYMGKVVKEIQSISLSLRMIPIKSVFKKMQRTVRTISELQNKKVNFITEGEDVELDKVVVDLIGDPLTHLIRNALDHGIETPEERAQRGKTAEATLILKAEHKEGNVYITVKDDGRGIDKEKIWAKAIEKGLISSNKKREFTDDEMLRILTMPGFSTKEEINEISGRGVGLDVVRTTIEGIKGTFWIDSQIDVGTTFYINIPLTLSIIEGMVISLGDMKYVVPMGQLVETINNSRYITVSSAGKGRMINLRGEVIPVLDLAKMIHGNRSRSCENEQKSELDFSGLVINYGGRKVSLEVGCVHSQQQIVIKNLGKELVDIPGIIGGFILGDGEAGLILNLPEIVKYNAHLLEKNNEKVAYN